MIVFVYIVLYFLCNPFKNTLECRELEEKIEVTSEELLVLLPNALPFFPHLHNFNHNRKFIF